ncbi:cd7 antigen-like [Cynoglossus semilaevis]|uniref:cd7 antigen-like n=1 Tax=Cynoglossus semilaevis TaxID=244447 RepID=UPI0004975FB9|nr:uncharacterized protein LOC103383552 [Cynoglossus semilaevis]
MTGPQLLASFWTLWSVTLIGFVHSDIQFLERHEGESVVLPCVVEQTNPAPFAVALERSWLQNTKVMFMHTQEDFSTDSDDDQRRFSVSGDPSVREVNVTLSELKVTDTDRYYCTFYIYNPTSTDLRIRGTTEFFLLVTADAPGSLDMGLVETCVGGSAVLPCLPVNHEGLAVEGVSLKRQQGQAPVEMLYHSQHQHGSTSSLSSTWLPPDRVQLSTEPGPRGIAYSLTLQQLQAEDSGLYSCQLLLHGRSETSSSLGRQVFFVSVKDDTCSCSTYSTLLYALSSATVLLLLLLLSIGSVVICKGRKGIRQEVRSLSPGPIYEEMVAMKPQSPKPAFKQLEEAESSEYRNCSVNKSCPQNHYEIPTGVRGPRM